MKELNIIGKANFIRKPMYEELIPQDEFFN